MFWGVPMFFVAVAQSEEFDVPAVLSDLDDQLTGQLEGRAPQAGILFAAIDIDHEALLAGLAERWPALELIGCTTDGEISSVHGFCEDSVSLILFGSDGVTIRAGLGRSASADSEAACRQAIARARADDDGVTMKFCIALPESMTTSGQQIVETLQRELGDEVAIFGAGAADQWRMKGTRQFFGNEVVSDSVPVLLFSGAMNCSFAAASGWRPVGEPGLVTRSSGPVVEEIDGRPAIEFFRRRLGEAVTPTPETPLAVLDGSGGVQYLRAPSGFADEKAGSTAYTGDVPQGSMVQIAIANRDAILEGCRSAVQDAFAAYPHGKAPEAALIFSCAARKLLLGTRTSEEFAIVRQVLGEGLPVCGFYGYGEIGPLAGGPSPAKFHNETFVCLLMGN
jgi:hypothetical protein